MDYGEMVALGAVAAAGLILTLKAFNKKSKKKCCGKGCSAPPEKPCHEDPKDKCH